MNTATLIALACALARAGACRAAAVGAGRPAAAGRRERRRAAPRASGADDHALHRGRAGRSPPSSRRATTRVTYTQVAAGVDASDRRAQQRRLGLAALRAPLRLRATTRSTATRISGIARGLRRGRAAGADDRGRRARRAHPGRGQRRRRRSVGFAGDDDATSQIYSAYAGPVGAHAGRRRRGRRPLPHRLHPGRSARRARRSRPAPTPVDVFDDSTVHTADVARRRRARATCCRSASASAPAGTSEDISNLDQRVDDRHVRADVTVPLGPDARAGRRRRLRGRRGLQPRRAARRRRQSR